MKGVEFSCYTFTSKKFSSKFQLETMNFNLIFLRLLNQVHDQNDEMKFLKALLSAEHAKLANFWSRVLQICTANFL